MRILIAGGGDIGREAAKTLSNAGNDVVLIEENRQTCELLASELDVMVVCGDATRPEVLENAGIEKAGLVIALSGNDKMNLLTALVAKEFGAKRVIVKLDDPEFNPVCQRLGVEEIINPKIATAKHIADMARRPHALEVSTLVGGTLRSYTAIIQKKGHAGERVEDLGLPKECLPVVVKREEEFFIPREGFKLLSGDHLTVLCEEKNLEELAGIFG